ncbi:hypothetical protein AB1Y20_015999 [Prymnesium parvum]|uniref:Uncharacterized protein n=1 Tax=Prymnesium parvum TaxID=97485 RepID=A0AB34IWJ1_PRYPA
MCSRASLFQDMRAMLLLLPLAAAEPVATAGPRAVTTTSILQELGLASSSAPSVAPLCTPHAIASLGLPPACEAQLSPRAAASHRDPCECLVLLPAAAAAGLACRADAADTSTLAQEYDECLAEQAPLPVPTLRRELRRESASGASASPSPEPSPQPSPEPSPSPAPSDVCSAQIIEKIFHLTGPRCSIGFKWEWEGVLAIAPCDCYEKLGVLGNYIDCRGSEGMTHTILETYHLCRATPSRDPPPAPSPPPPPPPPPPSPTPPPPTPPPPPSPEPPPPPPSPSPPPAPPKAVEGCTNPAAVNYNPLATRDARFDWDFSDGFDPTQTLTCAFLTASGGYSPFYDRKPGCWDEDALNYWPDSTRDGGVAACVFSIFGCTDPGDINYDPRATFLDRSACKSIYGCIDPDATNYMPFANTMAPEGSGMECVYSGCTNPLSKHYDPKADFFDYSCLVSFVCANPNATSYVTADEMARQMQYVSEYSDGEITLELFSDDSQCTFRGCMDSSATNYNPSANSRGKCVYASVSIRASVLGAAAACAFSLLSPALQCPRSGCVTSNDGTLSFRKLSLGASAEVELSGAGLESCVDSALQGGTSLNPSIYVPLRSYSYANYMNILTSLHVSLTSTTTDAPREICRIAGVPANVECPSVLVTAPSQLPIQLLSLQSELLGVIKSCVRLHSVAAGRTRASVGSLCLRTLAVERAAVDVTLNATSRTEATVQLLHVVGSTLGLSLEGTLIRVVATAIERVRSFTRQLFTSASRRRQLQGGAQTYQEALQMESVSEGVGAQIESTANGTTNSSELEESTSEGALANASASAQVSVRFGCLDHAADNFDSLATVQEEGACVVGGCNVSTDARYNPEATYNDGSCTVQVEGCTEPTAPNYNPNATVDDNSCAVCGCRDSTSFNYAPSATAGNAAFCGAASTCSYAVVGCVNPNAENYNPNATISNASACVLVVRGCTDPSAINFQPGATADDSSCVAAVRGCTDSTALNYVPGANTDDVNASCIPVLKGCTDSSAVGYDATANTEDNSRSRKLRLAIAFAAAPAHAA